MIALAYVGGIKLTYRMEQQEPVAVSAPPSPQSRTPGLIRNIVLLSIVLVVAAWWLAQTGDVLSTHPIPWIGRPLGATFVGAVFLAIASSLPEIVTGVAAVRLRNLDLALGNIFGSNMFNIFVIPMAKVVSLARGDALLMAGPHFHPDPNIIAGLLAILLTAVAVGGLAYRSTRRIFGLGPDSVLIGLFYIGGTMLLLAHS
jgi:cation:H+ antiporter